MAQPLDPRLALFRSIVAIFTARGAAEHPLAIAAEAACDSPTPAAQQAFQTALEAMEITERDVLLAEAHRRMREDMAEIWRFLPGAGLGGGLH